MNVFTGQTIAARFHGWNFFLTIVLLSLTRVGSASAQPVTNDTLTITSAFHLNTGGEYGRPYVVQSCPSLSAVPAWVALTNFIMPGTGVFNVAAATNLNMAEHYYRLVRGPVLADSVKDFSGIQGGGNWFYGYYVSPFTAAQFTPFTVFTPGSGSVGGWTPTNLDVWTRIFEIGGHPNGTATSGGKLHVEHWAVRRWQSPVTRQVSMAIYLRDLGQGSNGDGIIGRVFVNGAPIATYSIAEGTEQFQTLKTDVQAGSLVDFAIDPKNGSDLTDRTEFSILIY